MLFEQYGNSLASRRRVVTKDSFSSISGSDAAAIAGLGAVAGAAVGGGGGGGAVTRQPFGANASSSASVGGSKGSGKTNAVRESASSILYSNNNSNSPKSPAFGRSNTLGFGSSSISGNNSGKGMLTPKGLARSESLGPGMVLDLDADSDAAGMWRTNFTPLHAKTDTGSSSPGSASSSNKKRSAKPPSGLLAEPLIE